MHLDRRGYAYETFREGGKVRRRYCGGGECWGAIAHLDYLDREHRADDRRAARVEVERKAREAACGTDELKAFCEVSGALFRAFMQWSGYHQPKRGKWRKRRHNMSKTPATLAKMETKDLMLLARKGDPEAAKEFWRSLQGKPEEREVLAILTSGNQARDALIDLRAKGPDAEFLKGGFHRHLDLMRDDLAGPNPSALEIHLAERVTLCHFQLSILETLFAASIQGKFSLLAVLEKQVTAAHRRHLDAVKALATVRKLQLPTVQVNIGEKQVNVAAG